MSRLDPLLFDLHHQRAGRLRREARTSLSWSQIGRCGLAALRQIIANIAKAGNQPLGTAAIHAHLLITQPLDPDVRCFIARHLSALLADQLALPGQRIALLLEATPYASHHLDGEFSTVIGANLQLTLPGRHLRHLAAKRLPPAINAFLGETFGPRFAGCSFAFTCET